MYCLGLTGMIASGKSSVAKIFQNLGALVINADQISRDLTNNNQEIISKITNKFGAKVLDANNKLNRTELRNIIFNDSKAKQWLEDLLHPLIRAEINKQVQDSKSNINVIEIPLLKDRKPFPYLDKVLLITTDKETQINRIMQRDNFSRQQAEKIILSQPSLSTYKSVADIIIDNSASSEQLNQQIEELFNKIKEATS